MRAGAFLVLLSCAMAARYLTNVVNRSLSLLKTLSPPESRARIELLTAEAEIDWKQVAAQMVEALQANDVYLLESLCRQFHLPFPEFFDVLSSAPLLANAATAAFMAETNAEPPADIRSTLKRLKRLERFDLALLMFAAATNDQRHVLVRFLQKHLFAFTRAAESLDPALGESLMHAAGAAQLLGFPHEAKVLAVLYVDLSPPDAREGRLVAALARILPDFVLDCDVAAGASALDVIVAVLEVWLLPAIDDTRRVLLLEVLRTIAAQSIHGRHGHFAPGRQAGTEAKTVLALAQERLAGMGHVAYAALLCAIFPAMSLEAALSGATVELAHVEAAKVQRKAIAANSSMNAVVHFDHSAQLSAAYQRQAAASKANVAS